MKEKSQGYKTRIEIVLYRVRTRLSSSTSMTFHDLFKFSITLGLAVTFENLF